MFLLVFLLFSFQVSIVNAAECGLVLDSDVPARSKRMIIGGTEVAGGTWPWQVSLLKYNEANGTWKWGGCGGTLIGERWVLTAAHCKVWTNYSVLIGSIDASGNYNSEEIRLVNRFIQHPTYEVNPVNDDIALLELEDSPLNSHPFVCLPSRNQSIQINSTAVATGHGATEAAEDLDYSKITFDKKLRQTKLTIHSLFMCGREHHQRLYDNGKHPQFRGFDLGICAGSVEHLTAKGDSGGPLMMKSNDGRWVQIGITMGSSSRRKTTTTVTPPSTSSMFPNQSYAFESDEDIKWEPFEATFANVQKYCDWIEQTTEGEVKCPEEEVAFQELS